jgi:hypothetical protein
VENEDEIMEIKEGEEGVVDIDTESDEMEEEESIGNILEDD